MKERILIVVCVLLVLYAGYRMFTSSLIAGGEQRAGVRVVDVETGERFTIQLGLDHKGWPVRAPSGKTAGYPAEVCYQGKCGQIKGGTWVILNEMLGKPSPTLCPVCGNEVIAHNPLPPGHYIDPDGLLRQRTK